MCVGVRLAVFVIDGVFVFVRVALAVLVRDGVDVCDGVNV